MPKKFTENSDEKTDDNKTFILVGSDEKSDDEFRVFGIVGDINEEKSSEAIYSLMHFHRTREIEQLSDPADPNSDILKVVRPIQFILSTHGGSAEEMFVSTMSCVM